jgi:hypothetical protein
VARAFLASPLPWARVALSVPRVSIRR